MSDHGLGDTFKSLTMSVRHNVPTMDTNIDTVDEEYNCENVDTCAVHTCILGMEQGTGVVTHCSHAGRTCSGLCSEFQSLLVMNTSSRFSPAANASVNASPTSPSLPSVG